MFLDLANLSPFKPAPLFFWHESDVLWGLPYFLKNVHQAHLVLNLPQILNKSLSKELWFFYLINPLMCIKSPITAFNPSPPLCGCHAPCSGSDYSFLDIHIRSAMGSLLTILGLWLNSDSSSHAVPSAVTGSSLYLDSDTLLWTIETTALFPTIDLTLLYLTIASKLKYSEEEDTYTVLLIGQ